MSHDDCDQMIKELEAAGVHEPEGRSFHAAYGDDEVSMLEVWDSQEQFDEHHRRVVDVLEGLGVSVGPVEVQSLHSSRPD
jgi:hypothetical protein